MDKLLKWLIFSVVIALLPIIFYSLQLLTRGLSPTLELVTSKGELLLISTAMAAGALGELITSQSDKKIFKIIAGGGSVIILLICSLYYADVASCILTNQAIQAEVVSRISIIGYCFSFISSGSCIFIAEVGNE